MFCKCSYVPPAAPAATNLASFLAGGDAGGGWMMNQKSGRHPVPNHSASHQSMHRPTDRSIDPTIIKSHAHVGPKRRRARRVEVCSSSPSLTPASLSPLQHTTHTHGGQAPSLTPRGRIGGQEAGGRVIRGEWQKAAPLIYSFLLWTYKSA
jgi:hypothetical protein